MTQREIGLAILAAALGLLWLRSWLMAWARGRKIKHLAKELKG